MSWGEIAGLIAAVAFAVLVVFIILALRKVSKILDEVSKIANEANNSISIITKDVDNLSIEVEGLLNKSNTLMDDLNGKIAKTDPLFTAVGDIGVTVSDVNQSTRNLAANISGGGGKSKKKKSSPVSKLGRTATTLNRQHKERVEAEAADIEVY